jgi:hypothetical protein
MTALPEMVQTKTMAMRKATIRIKNGKQYK